MAVKRKLTDWDSIEPLYRAGTMSLNDICNQYAADHVNSQVWKNTVVHTSILRRAKSKGWQKNIADKVRDRIKEKLVSTLRTGLGTSCAQSESELIETAAEEPVRVALGQRARTSGALDFQDELLQELRDQFKSEKEIATPDNPVDVMGKVRAFKNIVVSMKGLQDQQASQYNLNAATTTPVTGIDISFVGVND